MKALVTGVKGQLGFDVVNELKTEDMMQWAWISKKWISPTRKASAGSSAKLRRMW